VNIGLQPWFAAIQRPVAFMGELKDVPQNTFLYLQENRSEQLVHLERPMKSPHRPISTRLGTTMKILFQVLKFTNTM
jgi:hypothetical protein